MAIEPNIALGVRGIEIPNQLAQYAQVSQIQNAQQANQLHQLQMAEYERARREEEGTRNFLAKADLNDPNIQRQLLTQYGKPGREIATTLTAAQRAQTEEAARQQKLAQDTQALYQNMSGMISNKNDAISFLQNMIGDPSMKNSPITRIPFEAQVAKIPEDPQGLDDWKKQFALGATKYITENKPVTFAQDFGTGGRVMSRAGLGGPATVVPGSEFTKGKTFADITSERQANLAQLRLAFDQAKFAYEKANPTMSIQEDPSGLLAVNTRTGVATPVVYGPMGFQAAPTAAPGASMMRQPPAALPGQRIPAIPGMTSVLDQVAASNAAMPLPAEGGVRVPGAPVSSKKEAPAKFNDTDMQLAGLTGSLKEFKDEVGKNLFTGAKFVPSGQDTARMTAKYTALLMGVKDLYTLGALTGPDMSIIESQLTNPASWSGKFTSKKGFDEQIKVIEDMLKRTITNLESTYGRVPKASKRALEGLPGGAAGGISGATANDPLGLGIR
jgi:hypothetical protein